MTAPATYLGAPVPEPIAAAWNRPDGAACRQQQYRATNRLYPPTEHTRLAAPDGMCPDHLTAWRNWREHRFDPVSGDRWPGDPGDVVNSPGLTPVHQVREQRRVEWDQKTLAQMIQLETWCAAGTGCSDLPRDLTWTPTWENSLFGWDAELEHCRYRIRRPIDGRHTVHLAIDEHDGTDWATIHTSRHAHPKLARRAAGDHWRAQRDHLLDPDAKTRSTP